VSTVDVFAEKGFNLTYAQLRVAQHSWRVTRAIYKNLVYIDEDAPKWNTLCIEYVVLDYGNVCSRLLGAIPNFTVDYDVEEMTAAVTAAYEFIDTIRDDIGPVFPRNFHVIPPSGSANNVQELDAEHPPVSVSSDESEEDSVSDVSIPRHDEGTRVSQESVQTLNDKEIIEDEAAASSISSVAVSATPTQVIVYEDSHVKISERFDIQTASREESSSPPTSKARQVKSLSSRTRTGPTVGAFDKIISSEEEMSRTFITTSADDVEDGPSTSA